MWKVATERKVSSRSGRTKTLLQVVGVELPAEVDAVEACYRADEQGSDQIDQVANPPADSAENGGDHENERMLGHKAKLTL